MTPEQKAAFVVAQAAMLSAKVAGMQATNCVAAASGKLPVYKQSDFEEAAESSGCGHNYVLSLFQGY